MDYYKSFRDQRDGVKADIKFQTTFSYRPASETKKAMMKKRPNLIGIKEENIEARARFLKQMGIEHVQVHLDPEDLSYDGIQRAAEAVRSFGLIPYDIECGISPKHDYRLNYGGGDTDKFLETYAMAVRACGAAGIPVIDLSWGTGVTRTQRAETPNTQYAKAGIFDRDEYDKIREPIEHEREAVWSAFENFCDHIMPVCEEANVNIALHPNDPPYIGAHGVGHLILTSDDYRRAFKYAGKRLGMKLCLGCWLEGGEKFGDPMKDIAEFVADNRVHVVHFRNVIGSLSAAPYHFEETLLDNGYMDMYQLMKQLVKCGYHGAMTPDHVPLWERDFGGTDASFAWSLGYMKALMLCAEGELGADLK